MKKKGTRRCLHQDTKSLITPSLHLCFFQEHFHAGNWMSRCCAVCILESYSWLVAGISVLDYCGGRAMSKTVKDTGKECVKTCKILYNCKFAAVAISCLPPAMNSFPESNTDSMNRWVHFTNDQKTPIQMLRNRPFSQCTTVT